MSALPDQKPAAIESQELNVFDCGLDGINQIEASAGTGKTWNMCGLYLRLLLERELQVQQILVVTFTKAATAELRERIRSRISDTLAYLGGTAFNASDPFVATLVSTLEKRDIPRERMTAVLELALQSFDEAAIFTIHGFCQRALADAPFAAGMPFSTELQADDSAMVVSAVNDFWRRHISSGAQHPELTDYLLAQKDSPEKFAKLLKRQLAKTQSTTIWPDTIDADFTPRRDAIETAYGDAASCWAGDADAVITLLNGSLPALNGSSYKEAAIREARKEWQRYFDGGECMAMPISDKSKLPLLSSNRLTKGTKVRQTTPQHPFFDLAQTLLTLLEESTQDLGIARLRLLRMLFTEGADTLAKAKREQRIQSYDDILYNVFAALRSQATPWLAGSLLARYPAALIDEFQDTDPLQFAIFDAIYSGGKNPLFFVGDPKQAIYSFRNADLQTYLQARGKATAHYSLAENQRSSDGLITAQNALFSANKQAFILPGLHYQDVRCGTKPRAVFKDMSASTAPLQLWSLPSDEDGNFMLGGAAKRAAERATAAEIARLLNAAQAGQLTLDDRPLQAGDIAVLVRSHAQGSAIRNALASLGIGSVELSQASIFDSIDAEELERLLQAVLSPTRSDFLMTALATELLGHDASAIDRIAGDEAALQKQIENFDAYRALWRERGIGFMYRRLLSDEGVSRRMLARADGERRMTNLLHLGEYLHQAGHDHPAPDALLRWLNAQRRHAIGDEAAQLRLESDQNLVQIVTIHRSKGLEYPVVFCPFLWSGKLASGPPIEGREYHDNDGTPVIDFRDAPDDLQEIKATIRQEASAEFLRLIYVAMTRAAHRCYLITGCYGVKTKNGLSTTESTRSLLNWLVAGGAMTATEWFEHKLSPNKIQEAWHTLAENGKQHIGIVTLPMDAGVPVQFKRPAADTLRAQRLPKFIRDGWRMTSFSALQHATASEQAGSDHDARSTWVATRPEQPPPGLPADDILRFSRGASAGDTLHAILENIDFANRSTWSSTITQGLRSHPQKLFGIAPDQQLPLQIRMVGGMIARMADTELANGIKLANLQPGTWLSELEFNLPAPRLNPEQLNALLAKAGYVVAPLVFRHMEGYLKGFIDLVFEADGRYYLLDWKSNHLGYEAADYDSDGMETAMAQHGYHLQYLLYALALHRYLGQRVKDYCYDTHVGGVLYLFMRGIRHDWKTGSGDSAGVYFHKPHKTVIDALDAMFNKPITSKTRSAA